MRLYESARNSGCRAGLASLRCELSRSNLSRAEGPWRAEYPQRGEIYVRKLLIGAIAGVVMLAVAAIAMAVTTTTYEQTYSKKTKSTSVGTTFKTTSTADQGDNPSNNDQPKSTREFDIKFPAGTKIDYKAKPVCTDANFHEDQASPCPANTKVGAGNATVKLPFPGQADVQATVTAYNRKSGGTTGLVLYVQPSIGAPVFLKPVFKGITLKTAVPPTCVASTNQNGHCVKGDGSPGQEAVLTSFNLKTKAFKKGKHTYIKSPPKCPKSGAWTFKATVTYDDNSTVTKTAKSKCKK